MYDDIITVFCPALEINHYGR